ncbi:MAG: NifB/NifX family molybdenum-iron cluster-binding protein [Lachnospiraceae bacterium]|nr:NifB/NifX family molybdenum-iron cluster-binding protein [Lachnospiraceae bacterium]
MRIAVTYENGQIYQHFGHTEQFKIYDVTDGKIQSCEVVGTNGHGHGALAEVLNALHADVLICSGIGGGAQAALSSAGIQLYGGVTGDADAAVEAFLSGTLSYVQNVQCGHHEGEQHHGGNCGGHGEHQHGESHECRHGRCTD